MATAAAQFPARGHVLEMLAHFRGRRGAFFRRRIVEGVLQDSRFQAGETSPVLVGLRLLAAAPAIMNVQGDQFFQQGIGPRAGGIEEILHAGRAAGLLPGGLEAIAHLINATGGFQRQGRFSHDAPSGARRGSSPPSGRRDEPGGSPTRHAPYFPNRCACAIASDIRYIAWNCPKPPCRQLASPNSVTASVRHVGAAQQRRHRMPAMALHLARRAVVARHDQHVRLQRADLRNRGVEALDHLAPSPGSCRPRRCCRCTCSAGRRNRTGPIASPASPPDRQATCRTPPRPCRPAGPGPCTSGRPRSPPPSGRRPPANVSIFG